jgi:hypothetical protein
VVLSQPAVGNRRLVREVQDASQARLRLLAQNNTYTITRALEDRPMSFPVRGGSAANADTVVGQMEHISRWLTTELANKRSLVGPGEVELRSPGPATG